MGAWNPKANSVFLTALEIDAAQERRRYLDEACAPDTSLRAHVESLLSANERAGSFLDAPASGLDAIALLDGTVERVGEAPGTMIGAYKLLQEVGAGGMGVVFLAEQSHPVRRQVALKVIKPGMDTRQVVARFESERQALAMMDHP